MSIAQFMKFCINFNLDIRKDQALLIFKRFSTNHKDLTYFQFKDCLLKIASKLEIIKAEQQFEEAFIAIGKYLELDNQQMVDHKLKHGS